MTAIVCVDEAQGTTFHGRRQSQDRAVCACILEDTAGRRLWMSRNTLRPFEASYPEYLTAAEDFLAQAGPGEFCFAEEPPLSPWLDRLEGLVLYRWNRRYPADAWLDAQPGPPGWTLARREEFPDHSCGHITEEVYTRWDASFRSCCSWPCC